jgi:hypothetical protein
VGQGRVRPLCQAHNLNAPGKFFVFAPEHGTPRRARAYLVTDDDVARVVAHYSPHRPQLDGISRSALSLGPAAGPAVAEAVPWYLVNAPQGDEDEPADIPDDADTTTPEGAPWLALCTAPGEGADIAELMRLSGMTRPTQYRHLAVHIDAGRAVQVSRGRWRATTTQDEP